MNTGGGFTCSNDSSCLAFNEGEVTLETVNLPFNQSCRHETCLYEELKDNVVIVYIYINKSFLETGAESVTVSRC